MVFREATDYRGPVIAESRVPLSRRTTLRAYVRRSENGRVAVLRLPRRLTDQEAERLRAAAYVRLGRLYDARPDIARRAPVPLPSAQDSLSLPVEQDARMYRGDAEWRHF